MPARYVKKKKTTKGHRVGGGVTAAEQIRGMSDAAKKRLSKQLVKKSQKAQGKRGTQSGLGRGMLPLAFMGSEEQARERSRKKSLFSPKSKRVTKATPKKATKKKRVYKAGKTAATARAAKAPTGRSGLKGGFMGKARAGRKPYKPAQKKTKKKVRGTQSTRRGY